MAPRTQLLRRAASQLGRLACPPVRCPRWSQRARVVSSFVFWNGAMTVRCVEAYVLRGQVELQLERWRSFCKLDKPPNHIDEKMLSWVTAKLLPGLLFGGAADNWEAGASGGQHEADAGAARQTVGPAWPRQRRGCDAARFRRVGSGCAGGASR